MSFHVPEGNRVLTGPLGSSANLGNNGAFRLLLRGECIFVIASDGAGWEHVSVSFGAGSTRTPSWRQMCEVKDIFWDAEDAVMQLHPPASVYIDMHKGCLHLWKPLNTSIPLPPRILVGLKGLL